MKRLILELTDREIELLQNSTSDLGTRDTDCFTLQCKIASAIANANYKESIVKDGK